MNFFILTLLFHFSLSASFVSFYFILFLKVIFYNLKDERLPRLNEKFDDAPKERQDERQDERHPMPKFDPRMIGNISSFFQQKPIEPHMNEDQKTSSANGVPY